MAPALRRTQEPGPIPSTLLLDSPGENIHLRRVLEAQQCVKASTKAGITLPPSLLLAHPRQPKVGEFEVSLRIDQDVLGLQVAVENTVAVAKAHGVEELVEIRLRFGIGTYADARERGATGCVRRRVMVRDGGAGGGGT